MADRQPDPDTHGATSGAPSLHPHEKPHSIEYQLAEVYGLVDELHSLTDRIRLKVETVLDTLGEEPANDRREGVQRTGTGTAGSDQPAV